MRKSLWIAMSLTICTLAPGAAFSGGKGSPNSCGTDVPNVAVTIEGTLIDKNGFAITSDGNGPYVNTKGKNNNTSVGFQIGNCSYDLTMNLFSSKRIINVSIPPDPDYHNAIETTAWFFNFDRIGSVPVTPVAASADIATFQSWCDGGVQREADGSIALVNGLRQDVYAPCDIDNNGNHFARRNVGFSLVDDYGLRFQNSPIDHHSELSNGTAFIKVYHYAADATNPERWILEPDIKNYFFTSYDTAALAGDFLYEGQFLSSLLYSPTSGGQSKVGKSLSMPFRMVVRTTSTP
jgi:hypothetical protein